MSVSVHMKSFSQRQSIIKTVHNELQYLKDLWLYRELFYFLAWRDVKVRYKQTVLGAVWAVIQPFMTMVVFTIFFGRLAKIPSDGVPYPIFAYTALVPWTFFANSLAQCSNSLVNEANLITKVYFPRFVIPFSAVMSSVIDFAIAFLILIGMMLYYRMIPTANIIWLPFLFGLTLMVSLGVGFWLSVLNVEFRDVHYAVPFLIQLWMFMTPIAYSSSLIPQPWRTIYGLNPMVGVIEGFRWALLGTDAARIPTLVVSSAVSLVLFVTGAIYFRRMEKTFADIL